ncbi:aerobic respiration two-component sensor histidine kinase ArcB [Photobacterium iliopiscarium]|jgi:two-component system aerobic respiration control sensor histidine kinase ArcB|uniref:Aerobic respiration control sensor protein n=1 Tax=Photobacterium iliopiscarium TaxID=56192 RepID=A0A2T3MMA9_9GAMM|nr:aerobic respiration two-component sensor histidine kinase ArcB [Photobacterium iliopiscarium]KJG14384.1 ATPase [Photobacterium iliopiscarium]PST95237.1 aerobic respiration two-component sensor histidine kinase ArcB [Photobacterium iliopiscarium]PST99371.1 aerobic respiration two-component sensor histidine kinase ArcB [Photobacterium iliopiscarium]PSV82625.1 aerobic respiration two-component sensor histidine kinase ArcB [Photobacterium iliopiscarium]PSV97590.1 aerobic respiration two-compone
MKQVKILAQFYVDLLVKLGVFRFSLLLAAALVALALVVQISVTLLLQGTMRDVEIIRSVTFGLFITPWAVYFLSVVVDQLEDSRQRLSQLVTKLEQMRARDMELNQQLQANISRLNSEIEEREKAEEAREEAMQDLENEVYQRENAQLAVAEKSALLKSFLDASPDLIYYRNERNQFSGCNRAMAALVGKSEKELVGLTPWDVYPAEVAKHVLKTDQELFDDNTAMTDEQWLDYPNGKKALFELRKVPLYDRNGKRLGLMGFGRDITERKKYEDAQEKASSDKTAFISTISHELRTPLNGIVGLSRMLLETELTDEQRGYLRTVHVSAITLGNIFNDIIDLDKSDRRRLELLPQPLDFHEFVDDIGNISQLMAEQKGLRFDLECLTELPRNIEVDSTRLRQVLWNLIGNATKFTKQGGVVLSVSSEIHDFDANIIFEVEDSGIGIPKAEIDNIFAMYYQVQQGDDNLHAVGTGIGLAVSQQLVHLMGGDIHVDSEVGAGSTFTVNINVPLVEAAVEQHVVTEVRPEMTGLSIFMVEDIELNIVVAKSLLERLGHEVTVAMRGDQALAMFKPEDYDLVLLDIQLPDMTGFDVAQKLRQQYQDLPALVALTANVVNDKTEYLAKGMDEVLNKPLSVKAITNVIENLVLSCSHEIQATDVDDDSLESTNIAQANVIDTLLDLEMLISYVEIVGTEPVYTSIEMFEKMMPDYLAILDSNMTAKDQDGIKFEAHKIKGAAGSIGLKHIQQVAQKAQSPELPAWWENINDWVDEIKYSYQDDINVLKTWLKQQ